MELCKKHEYKKLRTLYYINGIKESCICSNCGNVKVKEIIWE